jgi:glutathione S-transferase
VQIYFIPFACSLAARIACNEAGLDATFVQTAPGASLPDGRPFGAVSPMDYVPALETDDGLVLTEGPAVLQYLADLAPAGVLAPANGTPDRYRMQAWLNLVSTEVHKGAFHTLMGRGHDAAAREAAKARLAKPFGVLSRHLDGREALLDAFSVADAYLLAVLTWCETAGVDLAQWPVLLAWRARLRQRPSVAAAMAAELPLLRAA